MANRYITLLPKWSSFTQSYCNHYRCACIVCENNPDVPQLWELDRIGITKEEFSPSERKTVSVVKSNLQKTDSGYIVRLPFKDDTRPSVNYRTALGQLNHLIQRASCNETFFEQYSRVIQDYVEKEFIKEIPNDPVEGHYLPHHSVFKRSTTTPLHCF